MKNVSYKELAMTGLAAFISFSVTSCAEDDFKTELSIGENLLAEGIESEIDGKIATLKIISNDKWTIDVPKDAAHWIYIPVTSGEGNQNVPVNIDANFGSAALRSSTITVTAGNIVQQIAVSQVPTYNRESVANADEAVNYITIASTKGVGLGLNLGNLEITQQVINLKAVDKLQKINETKYGSFFTFDKQAEANPRGAVIDSVDTKKDSLGVALSCDINYGDFKLNIGGAYNGDESKDHYSTEYKYGATYNIASASTDLPSIIASYNDTSTSGDNSEEQVCLRSLFTAGFRAAKTEVEEAYEEGDADDLNDAIEDLVDRYGSVVISGCDLGSSMSLWMKYNRDSIADIMHVDTAHVKMAVEAGLLNVGVGVEVGYKKEGIKVLENSSFKFRVSGGSKSTQDALASVLSTKRKKGDSDVVYNDLHEKLDAWISSLDADNPATLSYTHLKIYPIWFFFQDRKIRNAVSKWIEDNYEDKMDIIKNNAVNTDVADQ